MLRKSSSPVFLSMEYFNFSEAAHEEPASIDDLDWDPILQDTEEDNSAAAAALLFGDQPQMQPQPAYTGSKPMHPAANPCHYCTDRGLECFVAHRGVLQQTCSCCLTLYRECSFSKSGNKGPFFETLHFITEDVSQPTGGFTGRRALYSYNRQFADTPLDNITNGEKKSGTRFSRESIRVLKKWLRDHASHPYPSEAEKDELMIVTGLKNSQVSNWFANARRRLKIIDPTPPVSLPIPVNKPDKEFSELNPLERWKISPPEHEAAKATDIVKAMQTTPYPHSRNNSLTKLSRSKSQKSGSRRSTTSNDDSNHRLQTASVTNSENQSSISDLSFASAFSHGSSRGSFSSVDRKDRRRRRRNVPKYLSSSKDHTPRPFLCTFCTDTFTTKYDWSRHEKSMHLSLERWSCAPLGGVLMESGIPLCAFCRATNPDDDHLESHNFSACQEKVVQERTFFRKDHLNQHLKLVHGVKFHDSMNSWKTMTTEVKSKCGFCPHRMQTWQQRVDHIAAHFKAGCTMLHWTSDWGFEPHINALVEHACPPYMIAEESASPAPWSATKASDSPQYDSDNNCWRRLERGLIAFVQKQRELGVTITDDMLKMEAHMIIFGEYDAWNQTASDNAQWFAAFKKQNGLPETSPAPPLEQVPLNPPYVLRHKKTAPSGAAAVTVEKPNSACPPALTSVTPNLAAASRGSVASNTAPSLTGSTGGRGVVTPNSLFSARTPSPRDLSIEPARKSCAVQVPIACGGGGFPGSYCGDGGVQVRGFTMSGVSPEFNQYQMMDQHNNFADISAPMGGASASDMMQDVDIQFDWGADFGSGMIH